MMAFTLTHTNIGSCEKDTIQFTLVATLAPNVIVNWNFGPYASISTSTDHNPKVLFGVGPWAWQRNNALLTMTDTIAHTSITATADIDVISTGMASINAFDSFGQEDIGDTTYICSHAVLYTAFDSISWRPYFTPLWSTGDTGYYIDAPTGRYSLTLVGETGGCSVHTARNIVVTAPYDPSDSVIMTKIGRGICGGDTIALSIPGYQVSWFRSDTMPVDTLFVTGGGGAGYSGYIHVKGCPTLGYVRPIVPLTPSTFVDASYDYINLNGSVIHPGDTAHACRLSGYLNWDSSSLVYSFPPCNYRYSYHWNTGDATNGITIDSTGYYQISISTIVDSVVCPMYTGGRYIIADSCNRPIVHIGGSANTVCWAQGILFTDTVISSHYGHLSYLWNFGAGTTPSAWTDSAAPAILVQYTTPGTITAVLTVYDSVSGLSGSDSMQITVFAPVHIFSSFNDSIPMPCGDSLLVSISSDAPITIMWSTPLGIDTTGNTFIAPVPGLYSPSFFVDTNGCSAIFTCCGGGLHLYASNTYDVTRITVPRYVLDTVTLNISPHVSHDTVLSGCTYLYTRDSMSIRQYRVDSISWIDSGWSRINTCTMMIDTTVMYACIGCPGDTTFSISGMRTDTLARVVGLLTAPRTETDTLSDTTHGYSLNHYYVVERPLIVSTVVVTACDTFTIVDNIKIYISKVDSIFAVYHHDRVVLHCSGAPLVDTSYYTDLDTISTTVTHRDTILTSHHLGTTHNMATITTDTITRTLHAVDTVIVSTTYPVKHDTTAFLCGNAHTTDSMVVTMNRVNFVHRTDSTRLVQKACDSSLVSYALYTYYDTIYTLYADTTHFLTRDTTFDMTTATTGTVTRSELLYGTTTGVTPYMIPDTVRFNCGEIRSMEFITVFGFRMDTVHRTDSSRHVVRVCNGVNILDTVYTRYDTVTLLGKDTVRTTVRDTIMFRPDTVMTASVSYLDIDTSEENIEVYSSRDTIKTDEMLVITRYDTIVSGYLIDSFLYMHWDTTVSNHCTGALLYYGADSLYGSRYGTYTDTVTSVAFDTIRLIHDEPSIKIKVYPNPFFDHITVEGPGKIAGALYAINGQKIGEFSGIGKVEISTTNLALGTYMLVVYIDDKQTIEKMVKIE
jgi:hypothetical protein